MGTTGIRKRRPGFFFLLCVYCVVFRPRLIKYSFKTVISICNAAHVDSIFPKVTWHTVGFICTLFKLGRVARKLDFLHANNKGANKPALPRSLIGAFVILF